jgi:hypothetical protein
MKRSCFCRAAILATASLAFLLIPATHAQDSDYARVVRLSRVEGQVLVSHSGSDTWEEALVNLPLQEGDSLATEGGLAEVEFESGATLYLAENSVLQFTQLDFSGGGRATELSLTQGAGIFYANLTSQDSFRVLALTFKVTIPKRAEFRVDTFRDGATVQVLLGNVSVSTVKGSTNIEKGQSVTVHEKDFQDFSIGRLPNPDAFDQWAAEQSETIRAGNKDTLSYISSPNYYGLSDLSIYGAWVNIPGYGFSWRPFRAGFSWTPYFNGKWILDPRLGWIWVSNEPWGWMPYHFGSWLLSPILGWVWVPGGPSGLRVWQPARVNWVHVGNQIGWVAMSPKDRDGAPANLTEGVITKPGAPSRTAGNSNQILAGRELRNATSLKQPPADFASRLTPRVPRSSFAPAIRTIPQSSEGNGAIVFDNKTHTFINGNGGSETAAPASHLPQSNARTEIPRAMIRPPAPKDPHSNRVILPPPGPAPLSPQMPEAPSRILMNGMKPPAITTPAPLPVRPGVNSQPGQSASPLRVSPPPPQPPPRPVTSPPALQQPPSAPQIGSVARPATHTPELTRPPATVGTQQH